MHGSSVVLLAFFTSVVTAAGTVYVIERTGVLAPKAQAPDAVVPALQGLSEVDARANAAAAHVAILVGAHELSADAKPGTVLRQSIPPGQRVPPDHPVSIVLADELPRVPPVVGLTVADATQRVEQRGYHLQVSGTVADASVAPGLVVDQTPKAETAQPREGAVTVHIAAAPPSDVAIPKLVGARLAKAKSDLEAIGLKPTVRWVAMAETPTYVVLSQKPAFGAKVKPGEEIELTVCR